MPVVDTGHMSPEEKIADLYEIVATVDERGQRVEGKLDALARQVDNRFDVVNNRLGRLESDVATLKTDVVTLKTDVVTLKTDMGEVRANVATILDLLRKSQPSE